MGDQGRSEATVQPLAPGDFAMVMAKSRENRLAFATWLIFFRDHGRFPRGPSDLETVDVAAVARQIEVTVPVNTGVLLAERTAKRLRTEWYGLPSNNRISLDCPSARSTCDAG